LTPERRHRSAAIGHWCEPAAVHQVLSQFWFGGDGARIGPSLAEHVNVFPAPDLGEADRGFGRQGVPLAEVERAIGAWIRDFQPRAAALAAGGAIGLIGAGIVRQEPGWSYRTAPVPVSVPACSASNFHG